jgi:hypothetical protein
LYLYNKYLMNWPIEAMLKILKNAGIIALYIQYNNLLNFYHWPNRPMLYTLGLEISNFRFCWPIRKCVNFQIDVADGS